jgi:putative transposase
MELEAIMAQRKQHTGQFKARPAVEAIAGHKTVNQIASEYGIHPSQVNKWKKQALELLPEALSDGRGASNGRQEEIESRLYQQIGQLTMELEYLRDVTRIAWVVRLSDCESRLQQPLPDEVHIVAACQFRPLYIDAATHLG